MGFTFPVLPTLRNSWAMVEDKHHHITPYISILLPQHPHSYMGKIKLLSNAELSLSTKQAQPKETAQKGNTPLALL